MRKFYNTMSFIIMSFALVVIMTSANTEETLWGVIILLFSTITLLLGELEAKKLQRTVSGGLLALEGFW